MTINAKYATEAGYLLLPEAEYETALAKVLQLNDDIYRNTLDVARIEGHETVSFEIHTHVSRVWSMEGVTTVRNIAHPGDKPFLVLDQNL